MTRKPIEADNALCEGLIETDRASSSIEMPYLYNNWDTYHDIDSAVGVIRVHATGSSSEGVYLSVSMESEEADYDVGAYVEMDDDDVMDLIRYLIITTEHDYAELSSMVKDASQQRERRLQERKKELGIE